MRTLLDFPKAFQPLVVVTGDRREVPPQSIGDILAYCVSSIDFMFMNHLRLGDCPVLSDKQFVVDSAEDLSRRFGRSNILVIGSPAVNLLARKINEGSLFGFSISRQTKDELAEQYRFVRKHGLDEEGSPDEDALHIYHQCLEGIVDVDSILARFSGRAPNIGDLREKAETIVNAFKKTRIWSESRASSTIRPIRHLMHKLDKPGIRDSLSKTIRGESSGLDKDYGLISLGPNPFSEKPGYSTVYVAGVHGPGTALGLRLLMDKRSLKGHPYGGVYEVFLSRFAAYFERTEKARPRWETPEYEPDAVPLDKIDITRNLKVFLSSPAPKADQVQKDFDRRLREGLEGVCREERVGLTIEDPYTLALGVKHSFWNVILEYERDCDFVLHDMTGCAKGVMVEVGFSVGTRRPYFLIWNAEKCPVTDWREMRVPSLLEEANIEQVNISDEAGTTDTLRKKILKPALERSVDCDSCEGLTKETGKRAAFVYARRRELTRQLDRLLKDEHIERIAEEESEHRSRKCRICQVLGVADYAFIELSDDDPDSFIMLGMAKAMGRKTLALTMKRYNKDQFAWAEDTVQYQLDNLQGALSDSVPRFVAF